MLDIGNILKARKLQVVDLACHASEHQHHLRWPAAVGEVPRQVAAEVWLHAVHRGVGGSAAGRDGPGFHPVRTKRLSDPASVYCCVRRVFECMHHFAALTCLDLLLLAAKPHLSSQ